MSAAVLVPPRRAAYATEALLRDGTSVRIRAIRPGDKAALAHLFSRMSPESVVFRFFGAKRGMSEEELRRFTEVDFQDHVALVATVEREGREEMIGEARYIRGGKDRQRAEVAFSVADQHQGRGVGTLLLEHLAGLAAADGIVAFDADVMGGNTRMLEVFKNSGFAVAQSCADGTIHARFPLESTDHVVEASDHRAWRASAESVRALLHPRSVALLGASRDGASIGGALLRNLVRDGFRGPVYAVNPQATTVEGRRAYPSVRAIGEPIDLGVIAVPAPLVEAAVADCARAGAKGVVVISAGFAEASEEGKAAQLRVRQLARGAGMRLVGPNCMGVLNTDPEVRLNATFAPTFPAAGNVGMLSQSGALGLAILDYAQLLNIGVSSFVSVGNKADVSSNDLLAYWKDDPATRVIALYLESFGNPRRFARLAPEVARQKPIVAVKSGRSASGTRAASSHSASLACLDVVVDALFEQAGVIRTETLEDLFDVVSLLSTQPVPRGSRVGVVTNAGGPGILLADACEARGLTLPELAPATVSSLRELLPAAAGFKNPVDMIASARPDQYERTIGLVGQDETVDAVVVIYVPPLVTGASEIAAAIAAGAARVPAGKPVLTVFLSSKGAPVALSSGARGRLPSFSFPENAARALAAAERYGRWRLRPRGVALHLAPEVRDRVRGVVDRALAGTDGAVWLGPDEVTAVLEAAGIPLASGRLVPPEEAAQAADALGYPLVAKAIAPGLVHKTDVGGVVLGLRSAAEVQDAVVGLRERLAGAGQALESVLLQRQVEGGLEALVGVVSDPTFGPLVVSALGGVQVELLRDASFRLPPVTDLDAAEMLGRLKMSALFDGYRGGPKGDRAALVGLIQRVSALVEALPEIQELDLNPVKVLPPGQGAIAVDARIRVARFER